MQMQLQKSKVLINCGQVVDLNYTTHLICEFCILLCAADKRDMRHSDALRNGAAL